MNTNFGIFPRVLFIALFFLAPVRVVLADTPPSGAFIVSPAKSELILAPGETKTVEITLSNGTTQPLTVNASYADVSATTQAVPSDNPIKLGVGVAAQSLSQSIEFSKQSFDLLSGKAVTIPVTITIPKGSVPGGKYGSVVFAFHPGIAGAPFLPTNIAIESRIASVFYVRVSGEVKEEGSLSAFGLFNDARTTPSPSKDQPLRLQVAFENKGDVYLNPYGRITISGMFRDAKVLIVDPWAVLPSATRMREIDMLEPLIPGYYHAHLELNRGYKDVVDERDVSFWVLPSFIGWVIGLTVLVLLFLLIRRSLTLSRHSIS